MDKKHIVRLFLLLLLTTTIFISCSKEDDSPSYDYFVSKDQVMTYNKVYINNFLDAASVTYPEAKSLKPLVLHDVNVYRVVYETSISGEKVKCSGLLSVPVTAGSYPLLSFQNGTNTVNADSPGEDPLDYNHQLIEMLASMGYVVLYPDYPGFSESSALPHPYLVKDITVSSVIDMMRAVIEIEGTELPGIAVNEDCFLMGYSQGGWATMALHKALELDFLNEFKLGGSVCGAGPYNISLLFQGIADIQTYPMPVYLGYIVNAYSAYKQFVNPVSDIFKEPYASKIPSLYNGTLTMGEINNQLTTSVQALFNPEFISGLNSSEKYASVRTAMTKNSISAWHSYKPLMLVHGSADTQVNPVSTENIYTSMIQAGTAQDLIKKVIIPGADHGGAVAPSVVQGILFLNGLKN